MTRKAIIITGGPKTGKSSKAREIAEKNGAYVIASWEGLAFTKFGLSRALASKPATIIVEGFSFSRLRGRSLLKCLISDSQLVVDVQYKGREMLPVPAFIFVLQGELPGRLDEGDSMLGRFEIIDMSRKESPGTSQTG